MATREYMVFREFKIPSISGERTAMCEWDGPHDREVATEKARQLATADPGTRFIVFAYPPPFSVVKSDSLARLVEYER